MKNILLGCILLMTHTFADVSVNTIDEAKILPIEPTNPIVIPPIKRVKPIRPATKYLLMNQDNHYYTNVVSNCDKYLEIIDQKDKEIEVLKKEIESLRNKEQSKMQKSLKEAYDKEMQKFENRKSSIHTKSRAIISDTPID